jgi:hypothetical protein
MSSNEEEQARNEAYMAKMTAEFSAAIEQNRTRYWALLKKTGLGFAIFFALSVFEMETSFGYTAGFINEIIFTLWLGLTGALFAAGLYYWARWRFLPLPLGWSERRCRQKATKLMWLHIYISAFSLIATVLLTYAIRFLGNPQKSSYEGWSLMVYLLGFISFLALMLVPKFQEMAKSYSHPKP